MDVLATRSDAGRVVARLIEYDEGNVAAARQRISEAGLSAVTMVHGDAGDLACCRGAVPADLVILAGVFGNISDAGVKATIGFLPQQCAENATIIWTRTRRAPDLTGASRGWLGAEGFAEWAFHAPDEVLFSVGCPRVHRAAAAVDSKWNDIPVRGMT
ncbi:class I SAM-dependent methyltransferase [Hamadaea sp. NPDC051192]|uniref:class I SAM-dependent methyltransferase n=1 Tax=Hamadaea sp. NPDC051192 TaxID=3154940 RepID=UPI00343A932F